MVAADAVLDQVCDALTQPLAALGAGAMERREVAATAEALYERAAVVHAVARAGLAPPDVVLAAGQGSVQVSALDAAFSFDAPLADGEALVRSAGGCARWRRDVALAYHMAPSPLKEVLLREAHARPLRVVLISGFSYAARSLGIDRGRYVESEEVGRKVLPADAPPKDVANLERLRVLLGLLFGHRSVKCLFGRDWALPDGRPFRTTWGVGWWLLEGGAPRGAPRGAPPRRWPTPVPRWSATLLRAHGWAGARVGWRDEHARLHYATFAPPGVRPDGAAGTSALPVPGTSWLPASRVHLAPGTAVVVLHRRAWRDAVVERWDGVEHGNRHALRIDGEAVHVDLNERNHAAARMDSQAFAARRMAYLREVRREFDKVEDAITGAELRVEDQILQLQIASEEGHRPLGGVAHVADLARALLRDTTPPVLVRAEPGAGKTWSVKQCMWQMADTLLDRDAAAETPCLVPLVVYVQELARLRRSLHGTHLVLSYIRHKHRLDADTREMLEQAFEMRVLVLLVDGIDEAAALREMMEELVVCSLVPAGFRVAVTSRPEGVEAGMRAGAYRDFAVLGLRPLTPDDQDRVIRQQVNPGENATYDHLCAFRDIRQEHDRRFEESFFPEAGEREALAKLTVADRLYPDGVTRDPTMRQAACGGRRLVARQAPWRRRLVARQAPWRSRTVREWDALLAPGVLRQVDASLASLAGGPADEDALGSALVAHGVVERKAPLKLALLVRKRQSAPPGASAAALWPEIAARVDELYEAVEVAEDAFAALVEALAARLGVRYELGRLKDPIRVHEKACDDYASERDSADGGLPEACVLDVLRARLVVPAAQRALLAASAWLEGVQHGGATLTVLRLKNKFAALDPAHFRNLLVNARLELAGGARVFVELQVHHEGILALNDERHCHAHYNFFRAKLADAYQSELDALLTQTMRTFAEVSENPVLLSMLVVLLRGDRKLPRDRYELYHEAMSAVLERDLGAEAAAAREVLRTVACANHMRRGGDGVRFFTDADVAAALGEEQQRLWRRLLDREAGVPLVKTLSVDANGEYQFKHLSFQEALVVEALVEDAPGARGTFWGDDDAACCRLRFFYQNTLHIGACRLGEALFAHRRAWDLSRGSLEADDVRRLAMLLSGLREDGATVHLESSALKVAALQGPCIDLHGTPLGELDAVLVAEAARLGAAAEVHLGECGMGGRAAERLAEALGANTWLRTVRGSPARLSTLLTPFARAFLVLSRGRRSPRGGRWTCVKTSLAATAQSTWRKP